MQAQTSPEQRLLTTESPRRAPGLCAWLTSPASLSLPHCAQQQPLACSSAPYSEGGFPPGQLHRPRFFFSFLQTHLSSYQCFPLGFSSSDFSLQLLHLVSATSQLLLPEDMREARKMISHPLPRLHLPRANPVCFAGKGFVPFFASWEAVNRSNPLGETHMSRELPHSCFTLGDRLPRGLWGGRAALHRDGPSLGPGLCSGPAHGARLSVLTPGSPPSEELKQREEGSGTEGMRPGMGSQSSASSLSRGILGG